MAISWVEKGSLKGVKGDTGERGEQGIQGYSFRTVNTALSASATVPLTNITPSTNVQQGDKLIDSNFDVWEVVSADGENATVGAAAVGNIKGAKGDTGEKGEKGDDGTGVNIKGSVANAEALPGEGQPGDAYVLLDTGTLAVWDEGQHKFVDTGAQIKGPKGDTGAQGDPGAAATVTVGTTQTGDAGSQASVTNSGDANAAVFNFTIPRGAQGVAGPGVSVGSTAPEAPGTLGECYIDVTSGKLYRYEEAGE